MFFVFRLKLIKITFSSFFLFINRICLVVTYLYMPDEYEEEIDVKPKLQRRKKKPSMPHELVTSGSVVYESSMRGNRLLHYMGQKYIKNNVHGSAVYWKCTRWHNGCKARAITNMTVPDKCFVKNIHNH